VITINNTDNGNILNDYSKYLSLLMYFERGVNNNITGKRRRELTIKLVARFNIISPLIIRWLYGISRHQALEHLNKLVKENLLIMVQTHRSPDGRVYTLSYDGAKYAEEVLSMQIYFRSAKNPALNINQNSILHDLICLYVSMRGIQNTLASGIRSSLWSGFVTEIEFKRLFKSHEVRNVDGILKMNDDSYIALEVEHSFKNKNAREQILQKWLYAIKNGYYSKVFLFSHSLAIFYDIKRFHKQLFEELPNRFDKKTRQPILTDSDVELLKSSIIYRTKFCDEISELFYQ